MLDSGGELQPITALPHSTARAIGSASVISDPCSIAKELLDNALDASASSVSIEISPNTIDIIQVKDNGHGIPSSDHPVVCKHAYTSKIASVEDLRKVGNKSLGFRGEALASIAEVAAGVTVNTRVQAELVGSSITYGRNGELQSVQRASHPVGTSVRVYGLFKNIPVRRQATLKATTKTLARLKKLVQSYAIAQPSKRLSLRVLKGKNENNNFVYAPGQNATLMEAALKIFSKEVASNCIIKIWPVDEDSPKQSYSKPESCFGFVALLADPDSDFARVNNAGQHLSVDGRPISSTRGIGQDISKIYKTYLRSAGTRREPPLSITDPFLCLHIKGPGIGYDVNIEPSKDDVLFEDPQLLLSIVEDFFRNVYGESTEIEEKTATTNEGKKPVRGNGFDLLLARKSPPEGSPRHESQSTPFTANTPTTERRAMSKEGGSVNPWPFTRLSAPFRTPRRSEAQAGATALSMRNSRRQSMESNRSTGQSINENRRSSLFLPSPSSTSSRSTSRSPIKGQYSRVSQIEEASPTHPYPMLSLASRPEDHGNCSVLDTWLGKTMQANPSLEDLSQSQEHLSLSQLSNDRFGSRESPPSPPGNAAVPLGGIVVHPSLQGSPISEPERQNGSLLSSNTPAQDMVNRHQELPALEGEPARMHEHSQTNPPKGLEDALDFEHRKKEAIMQRREQIKNHVQQTTPSSSPHLSRYLAARAALDPANDSKGSGGPCNNKEAYSQPVMSPHDPRSYLLRHRNSKASSNSDKLRRISTGQLPFENIPEGYSAHNSAFTLPSDPSLVSKMYHDLAKSDLYVRNGTEPNAFLASCDSELNLWRTRLSRLIKTKYQTEGSGVPCMQFDFSAINEHCYGHE